MLWRVGRSLLLGMLLLACCAASGRPPALADDEPAWQRSSWFDEQLLTARSEGGMRVHVNAPVEDEGSPARGTRLIVYALPNGNTIEQTLGCQMHDKLDWQYDIQHVAAQVRLLRSYLPEERIVLVCAEAPRLSWPAFRSARPDANAEIARLVEGCRQKFGQAEARIMLTGHSGGGSFIFGVLEACDDIPETIDRIAFLDANYSFDAERHAGKLVHWLQADGARRLIVLAYDDREIMLDGKKVVSATGGTFRATQRMRVALGGVFRLVESERPPFTETHGLDGRLRFIIHGNPQNKILHTALVGEMNGLVHAATLGTPQEESWGTVGGPRAYTQWIQPEPTESREDAPAAASGGRALPPRPAGAAGGRAFVRQIAALTLEQREAAILREITAGNFPEFLRTFHAVPIQGAIGTGSTKKTVRATIAVMPDYLAVGSDADFVRMPMTPQTAQRIADAFGCTLPTRKLVDAIDAAAGLHLAPKPLTKDRESPATFLEHHETIERQRAGKPLGMLVTGIKKDIVLTPRIFERPERLAIYGWRQLDGKPIQPLTIVHWDRYVDYSHGVRLVHDEIELDGERNKITQLLADPAKCGLVSDEGPMDPPRYLLE